MGASNSPTDAEPGKAQLWAGDLGSILIFIGPCHTPTLPGVITEHSKVWSEHPKREK